MAFDEGRLVLVGRDAAGPAEVGDGGRVELATDLFADDLAAGEDRDVLEHRLAAVTEARGLDAQDVDGAAELVHDERGESLAVDVLGDDDQVLADLHELLEHRQDVCDGGDLLVGDEDVGVLDDGFHAVGVGDEVRRDVPPVDLHPLDVFLLELETLGLLDGDDAVAAHLVVDLRDERADLLVSRGDPGDVRDLLLALDLDGLALELGDDRVDALLETALEEHRVGARGDVLETLGHDRLRDDDGGRRAVAGDVVGLGRGFLEKLRAHVLERILELDLTRDGHAVVGHGRGAELLVDGDVAALGAEGRLDGVRHLVDAGLERGSRLLGELELLCHISLFLLRLDDREDVLLAEDQELLLVELELGARVLLEQDAIADLELDGDARAGVGVAIAGAH